MDGRKRVLARLALVLGVPLVLLGVAEFAVRALGLGAAVPWITLETVEGDPTRVQLRANGISTDTPHVSPAFLREKPAGTLRIALFGESAAAGFPHHLSATPARWLELLMRDRVPGLSVEVVDCAIAGIAGDWLEQAAQRVLPLGVDVAIVYAGNNEFLSAFIERARRRVEATARERLVDFLVDRFALARVVRRAASGEPALRPTRSPLDTRGLVETPLGPVRTAIETGFEDDLVAIGELARSLGVKTFFVRPVAARRDWPPLSSVPTRGLDPSQRAALERELEAVGLDLARGEFATARARLDAIATLDPGLALYEFRRGELLDLEAGIAGSPDAAPHYRTALDLDERPSRVNTRLAQRIERAAQRVAATYADADAAFSAASPDGLAPAGWLDDHVHFSIEGQYRLACFWMRMLEDAGVPRMEIPWQPTHIPDFESGVNALGIALGEVVANQVQLGFSSLIAGYEQPATQVEHFARARRKFESVLAESPGQPRALCGRGLLNAAEGKADAAIADFDAAHRIAARVPLEMRAAFERIEVFRRALDQSRLRFRDDGRLEKIPADK